MNERDDLRLRGARDRLYDLLGGFGKTAPLRDTPVENDLVVAFDTVADIGVDPGQVDVRYLLRNRDGSPVPGSTHAEGNDARTELRTPPIVDDVTFHVLGRKTRPNEREAYLHETAEIKVGLDTSLAARILAPPLDPTAAEPADGDPRVVDHAHATQVEVENSQVGIDYDVVTAEGDSVEAVVSDSVRGDGGTIVIDTEPFIEDALVRVRATRHFDPADEREDQVALLDVVLPLAVRPRADLGVALDEHVVDHGGQATLRVSDSQRGVSYHVRGRPLTWLDFAPAGDPGPTIAVAVTDEPDVHLRWPESPGHTPRADLDPIGSALPGTGSDLEFVLAPDDDSVAVVVAVKEHFGATSTLELERPVVAFVRPDPDRVLEVRARARRGRLLDSMRVSGGQPGVLYILRDPSRPDAPPLRASFPRWTGDPTASRGVSVTRVGYDFVVRASADDVDPVIPLETPLDLPARFEVRAVSTRTRVAAPMSRAVVVRDEPRVELEQENVPIGDRARILVRASDPAERYRPFVGGEPIRPERSGTGEDLVFRTDPLTVDTLIELRVTRPADADAHATTVGVALEAIAWEPVDARVVAPPLDPATTSDVSPRLVDFGAVPVAQVGESLQGVRYEIVSGEGDDLTVVSAEAIQGTGTRISIPLAPLQEDLELRFRVTKLVAIDEDAVEGRTHVTGPRLRVAVRANPGCATDFGDGTVDHLAERPLVVHDSQRSATYTAHERRLRDDEFWAEGDRTFPVRLGNREVDITAPWPDQPMLPEDAVPVGEPSTGTDDLLTLALPGRGHDALVVVTATKTHFGDRSSTVVLENPAVCFVHPDPDVDLALAADLEDGALRRVRVVGGQARVRYHLRVGARGAERELPAYVHEAGRGIERLRVGVDLVPIHALGPSGDPVDPVVRFARRVPLPVTLMIRAEMARTGLSAPLGRGAPVPAVPAIAAGGAVPAGSEVRVSIDATVDGETYQLMVDGRAAGEAHVGDGAPAELVTPRLAADSVVAVHVSRPAGENVPVVRVVPVEVDVT